MYNVYFSVLLIISSILLGNLFIYGIRRRKAPGVFVFSILMLAMIIHSMGYAFELMSGTLEQMYTCIRIEYIGASFYPFLILLFAREYGDEKKFANKYLLTLVWILNVVTLILVNSNSHHLLYYSSIGIDISPEFSVLALKKGMWYYVQVAELFFSILYSVIIFGIKLKKTKGEYKRKVRYVLIGAAIPLLTLISYMLDLGPGHIDLTPFSYLFMTVFISFGLLRHDIMTLTPVTYEMIFNFLSEAVLVIDKDGMLINFNSASVEFFPSLSRIKVGESIHCIDELKEYDFEDGQTVFESNDRILSFKADHMISSKVLIYVISDITKSEQTKRQLEQQATLDDLTGLYNRRHFFELIEKETREGVFAMIDIDFFKSINDTYGHVTGDEALSYFGNEIKKYFGDQIACRYGGEEFAVLMEGVSMEEAVRKMEAMRNDMMKEAFRIPFTFSAGLVHYQSANVSETLIKADQKLYEAKMNGRDQTCYAL